MAKKLRVFGGYSFEKSFVPPDAKGRLDAYVLVRKHSLKWDVIHPGLLVRAADLVQFAVGTSKASLVDVPDSLKEILIGGDFSWRAAPLLTAKDEDRFLDKGDGVVTVRGADYAD